MMATEKNRIKCVFSDLDNTILDFHTARRIACGAVIDRMGAGDREEFHDWYLSSVYDIEDLRNIADYQKHLGIYSNGFYLECARLYESVKMENIRAYPGVCDTIDRIRAAGIPVIVVTDATIDHAMLRLSHTDILRRLDGLITADMTGLKKPAEGIYRFALSETGMENCPEKTLFVGDSLRRDITPAKSVGMETVLASYGDHGEKGNTLSRPEYPADHIIEKYEEILEYL